MRPLLKEGAEDMTTLLEERSGKKKQHHEANNSLYLKKIPPWLRPCDCGGRARDPPVRPSSSSSAAAPLSPPFCPPSRSSPRASAPSPAPPPVSPSSSGHGLCEGRRRQRGRGAVVAAAPGEPVPELKDQDLPEVPRGGAVDAEVARAADGQEEVGGRAQDQGPEVDHEAAVGEALQELLDDLFF